MKFSVNEIKKDFPIFNNSDLIYLDNASTTQKPQAVLNTINSMYSETNANVHRSIYSLGSLATKKFEDARIKVSSFIGANSEKEIIFTSGTTESINLLAHSLGNTLKPGDEILVSEMEHHSNLVPWQLAANRSGANLSFIPLSKKGELDLSNPEKYFKPSTKIVSITHVSNVLGTVNPIKKLSDLSHKVGAVFIVDGAQATPHQLVNVNKLNCDFYTFSGHKMLGPTGIGVLWGKMNLLESMDPFMGGGEMIENVSMKSSTWNNIPYKFEAGTPNFVQAVGLGTAIDYIHSIGIDNISKQERDLTDYALEKLSQISGLNIFGSPIKRIGVISFNLDGIHPHDLAQFLNEDNIAIRVGHHCAQPLLSSLNENSIARISFYLYNDEEDIDRFCDAIIKIKTYF
tara:strand:+ start:519 stop:1721 length:1203 start_codon:yes stop_codon:yes gene_type:complete